MWKLLQIGDEIKEGDEVFILNGQKWERAVHFGTMTVLDVCCGNFYRRRVKRTLIKVGGITILKNDGVIILEINRWNATTQLKANECQELADAIREVSES